jgi:hypothetical protein
MKQTLVSLVLYLTIIMSTGASQTKLFTFSKAEVDSARAALNLGDSLNSPVTRDDLYNMKIAIVNELQQWTYNTHVTMSAFAPKGAMSRTKAEVATVSAKVAKLDSLERNMAALGELILKLSALNEQTANTVLDLSTRTDDVEKVVSIKGAIDPDDGNNDQKAAYERLIYRAKKSMSSAQK